MRANIDFHFQRGFVTPVSASWLPCAEFCIRGIRDGSLATTDAAPVPAGEAPSTVGDVMDDLRLWEL